MNIDADGFSVVIDLGSVKKGEGLDGRILKL